MVERYFFYVAVLALRGVFYSSRVLSPKFVKVCVERVGYRVDEMFMKIVIHTVVHSCCCVES